jgi:proteic killer suppression protein
LRDETTLFSILNTGLDVYRISIYDTSMISTFKCKDTQALHGGTRLVKWAAIEQSATDKLIVLDAAAKLGDLRTPGNNLEKLKGNRAGQYSIRINKQWRICFVWGTDGPENVEIVDYH